MCSIACLKIVVVNPSKPAAVSSFNFNIKWVASDFSILVLKQFSKQTFRVRASCFKVVESIT